VRRDELILAPDRFLLDECEIHRYRASGPGGQHRNKTESAVRLRHPNGISAIAEDSRSQGENKAIALRRIREHFALEMREPIDLAIYAPSPRLAAMVAGGTQPLGEKTKQKPEYLVAMAELLDLFAAVGAEVAALAHRLGVTTGAASKLVMHDDRVSKVANQMRSKHGLKPLR
jgi:hypothetical protein